MKKKGARLWLIHVICNIMDSLSNFVYVNEKFCNKKKFLDLFSVVLLVFPDFILPAECV